MGECKNSTHCYGCREARDLRAKLEQADIQLGIKHARIEARDVRIGRLEEALRTYGLHKLTCPTMRTLDSCDCGLDAALASVNSGSVREP